MKTCTFFGRADATTAVLPPLREAVDHLIVKEGVTQFYYTIQGLFEIAVERVLNEMQKKHPHIIFRRILAAPLAKNSWVDPKTTILPEEIKAGQVEDRYRYCNEWMLERSQYVITYLDEAEYAAFMKKHDKTVINISI